MASEVGQCPGCQRRLRGVGESWLDPICPLIIKHSAGVSNAEVSNAGRAKLSNQVPSICTLNNMGKKRCFFSKLCRSVHEH